MRVSMGQISATDDKDGNLAAIRSFTERAALDGADLVVFPEFAMYDLPQPDYRFVTEAESLDGRFATAVKAIAREFGVAIVAGMLEAISGEDRAHNTLLAVGKKGEPLATYRKVHLYDAFGARESDLIKPSDETSAVTFDLEGVTIGINTCYDVRFPESTRHLVDAGAQLVLLPSSWVPGPRKEEHWKILAQARAIENTVYFMAVNQAPTVSTGGSLFIDPMGIIVGELGEMPAVATYDVDVDRIAAVRLRNPSLTDRKFAVSRKVNQEQPACSY